MLPTAAPAVASGASTSLTLSQDVSSQGTSNPETASTTTAVVATEESVSGSGAAPARDTTYIDRIRRELELAKLRLNESRADEQECIKQRALEENKREEIQNWMISIQAILWPSTPEEIEAGRPLGQDNPPGFTLLQPHPSLDHLKLLRSLVPDIIRKTAQDAIDYGIDRIEDVNLVLEAFRWMSWCNLCLHGLRAPLSTRALKRLLDASSTLRADERVIRVLNGIASRARLVLSSVVCQAVFDVCLSVRGKTKRERHFMV